MERWAVAFAALYLDALEASLHGRDVPGPWAAAFAADGTVAPLRHVLLGMNAHINYDLPQALLAVISDAEFGDAAAGAPGGRPPAYRPGSRHPGRSMEGLTGPAGAPAGRPPGWLAGQTWPPPAFLADARARWPTPVSSPAPAATAVTATGRGSPNSSG